MGSFFFDIFPKSVESNMKPVRVVIDSSGRTMQHEHVNLWGALHCRVTFLLCGHDRIVCSVFDTPLVTEEYQSLVLCLLKVDVFNPQTIHISSVTMIAVHSNFRQPIYLSKFMKLLVRQISERDDNFHIRILTKHIANRTVRGYVCNDQGFHSLMVIRKV